MLSSRINSEQSILALCWYLFSDIYVEVWKEFGFSWVLCILVNKSSPCCVHSSDQVIPVSARQRLNENVSASGGAVCKVRPPYYTVSSAFQKFSAIDFFVIFTTVLPYLTGQRLNQAFHRYLIVLCCYRCCIHARIDFTITSMAARCSG